MFKNLDINEQIKALYAASIKAKGTPLFYLSFSFAAAANILNLYVFGKLDLFEKDNEDLLFFVKSSLQAIRVDDEIKRVDKN